MIGSTCVVVAEEAGAQVNAGGVGGEGDGVVRSARHEDAGMRGTGRDEDDGVEFDAVAHGDHDIAPGVVHASCGLLKGCRGFAGIVRVQRRGLAMRGGGCGCETE